MNDILEKIKAQALNAIAEAANSRFINDIRVKYLGKSGELSELLKRLKDVPKEDKPAIGKLLNETREKLEAAIEYKEKEITAKEIEERLSRESIDITLPSQKTEIGSLHPVTQVMNEIIDIFVGLGFEVNYGPEIELDYFNFQLLNIPPDHPSRDMQDTFHIVTDKIVLRTQTSSMQGRVMLKQKPPIRTINPGRTYRSDFDSSHSPMFHQIEGLVVDEKVTMCDLMGLLQEFAKNLFSPSTKIRFRPSYFPFTEPSVEVDVSCAECGGGGCRLCKGTGWIEVLGAGIVNPIVLENCGIDSGKYSGLAFGMGLERIAIRRYGISDMRIVYENDKRFLRNYR